MGYVLEIDLEYPQHVHDAHSDLPFCLTRENIRQAKGKAPHEELTLYDKKRYVIHYRNLQQYTRHGPPRYKGPSYTAIRAVSMTSRVHRTQYKF